MKIGIFGSGHIGGTLARLLSERGHTVFLASSRGPQSLREGSPPGVIDWRD